MPHNAPDIRNASMIGPNARSRDLHRRASKVMPSGNSRHSVFFPPQPVYVSRAAGKRVWDADGRAYTDFNNNFSTLIHGHAHPAICAAVAAQISRLGAIGAPTGEEVKLAECICGRIDALDRVRFCNSGTEAVMMAIKAARAYTGRSSIAKIEGAYHGTYDYAEVSMHPQPHEWGDHRAPRSCPASTGTPQEVADEVVVIPLNDANSARRILRKCAGRLAAILIDPLPSNIAYLRPNEDFLEILWTSCQESGALFIADEVYSLRLRPGGAQAEWPFSPDLTAVGKFIGGGFPVGAIGGRADVMEVFSLKNGPPEVAHGGTFNANPVTMAAGLESLEMLDRAAIEHINDLGARLRNGLESELASAPIPVQVTGAGSLAAVAFRPEPPQDFRGTCDTQAGGEVRRFIHRFLLDCGQFLAPQLTMVLSTVMAKEDVDRLVECFGQAMKAVPTPLVRALLDTFDCAPERG